MWHCLMQAVTLHLHDENRDGAPWISPAPWSPGANATPYRMNLIVGERKKQNIFQRSRGAICDEEENTFCDFTVLKLLFFLTYSIGSFFFISH